MIQDSAKKCRYCWEWIESKKIIENIKNDMIDNSKNILHNLNNVKEEQTGKKWNWFLSLKEIKENFFIDYNIWLRRFNWRILDLALIVILSSFLFEVFYSNWLLDFLIFNENWYNIKN